MATSITALPAVPSRNGAPNTFASDADLFIGALPTFRTEANLLAVEAEADALTASTAATTATTQADIATTKAAEASASAISAVNAPGTNATSTTSVLVGTGSKSLTIQTGKIFVVGQYITIARTSAPSTTSMFGTVTAYTSGTGALVVNVTSITGSGTFTDWTIAISAPAVTNLPFSSITDKPTTIAGYGITDAVTSLPFSSITSKPTTISGYGITDALTIGQYGFGSTSLPQILTNFNTIEVRTMRAMGSNVANAPLGDTGWFLLEQLVHNIDWVTQVAYGMAGPDNQIFFRQKNNGTWGTWRQFGPSDLVQVISGATTAVASLTYVLVASLTLTLPASPITGDWVKISNRSATVTAVIARNGQNIMGLAENMTFDNLNAGIRLVFTDAARGWVVV